MGFVFGWGEGLGLLGWREAELGYTGTLSGEGRVGGLPGKHTASTGSEEVVVAVVEYVERVQYEKDGILVVVVVVVVVVAVVVAWERAVEYCTLAGVGAVQKRREEWGICSWLGAERADNSRLSLFGAGKSGSGNEQSLVVGIGHPEWSKRARSG